MKGILPKSCHTEYFNVSDSLSHINLGKCLIKYLRATDIDSCTPVILCIGTDRATGDCLGPLVGDMLINYNPRYIVLGSLSEPVHALNLKETINYINSEIENPFVIAIDASLGEDSHVGYVTLSDCPIAPGKGVNKKLPIIGDVSITGIVNISGRSVNLLQSTRLHTVMQLACCIAEAVKYSIDHLDDFCPL